MNASYLQSFTDLCRKAKDLGIRIPLVVEAESGPGEELAFEFLNKAGLSFYLVKNVRREISLQSGPNSGKPRQILSLVEAKKWLGQETPSLIISLHEDFDPDVLGILAGTVCQGGVLCLLVPPRALWAGITNAQHERLLNYGQGLYQCRANTFHRLMNQLEADAQVSWITFERGAVELRLSHLLSKSGSVSRVAEGLYANADQKSVVSSLTAWFAARSRFPSVLTADRGRGKSTALGLMVLNISRMGGYKVVVTSSNFLSVRILFEYIESYCRNSCDHQQLGARKLIESSKYELILENAEKELTRLTYLPPDFLLQNRNLEDLVVVDEAASLPVFMLTRILDKGVPIVFSTTLHGYEGAGMGFSIMFRKELKRRYQDWLEIELAQPVRWSSADALEPLIFKALLLDAEPEAPNMRRLNDTEKASVQWRFWEYDDSPEAERLLRQIAGLLVQAHYQTRPLDIMRLIDIPGQKIVIALLGEAVIGVLWACEEGGLQEEGLEEAVFLGHRRPQGHLIPNSLVCHEGMTFVLSLKALRITRIVVHPEAQGQGIGSGLIQYLYGSHQASDYHYLCSSFALSPEVLCFWKKNEFTLLRIGIQPDQSSGLHSCMVARALPGGHKGKVSGMQAQAGQKLVDQGPLRMRNGLSDLELSSAVTLFEAMPRDTGTLPTYVIADVRAFSVGNRAYETCEESLWQFLWRYPISQFNHQLYSNLPLLVGKLVQRRQWTDIAHRSGLTGKKEAVRCLRKAFRAMLSNYPDSEFSS